ncbi:hypothetical protein Aple_061400 [Acrocarpospora pleiomorpha]|uniref:Uncharacterized protein n=2 Tax=Acrocarpospora pleiomorpha TaxID=90975 RepID=A0A5M3XUL7_9ACTN|nr:hypothetical protein Aple_061400 [Acrocarpospora pleiomorpha]
MMTNLRMGSDRQDEVSFAEARVNEYVRVQHSPIWLDRALVEGKPTKTRMLAGSSAPRVGRAGTFPRSCARCGRYGWSGWSGSEQPVDQRPDHLVGGAADARPHRRRVAVRRDADGLVVNEYVRA